MSAVYVRFNQRRGSGEPRRWFVQGGSQPSPQVAVLLPWIVALDRDSHRADLLDAARPPGPGALLHVQEIDLDPQRLLVGNSRNTLHALQSPFRRRLDLGAGGGRRATDGGVAAACPLDRHGLDALAEELLRLAAGG